MAVPTVLPASPLVTTILAAAVVFLLRYLPAAALLYRIRAARSRLDRAAEDARRGIGPAAAPVGTVSG
eukprot:CAMPEP_0194291290 /NCGR_PEP_ID=MMETSP0169-20130528/43138_1 /TAXON_ID=218684 /ORGANISM="Corethron pennatum, Strain L29A3" /LENGTH=67 /DNA_ID=CAMNT_0039039123 /DNA_START=93 /DNA_END=293 /DNA_ORIENTATION=+